MIRLIFQIKNKLWITIQIVELGNEITALNGRLKDYEHKLYKQGHFAQTIHMNQPKEFKSYNDKDGLGYVSPHHLSKAVNSMSSLYDLQYMRYGVTQNFIRVFDEERDIEEFRRSISNKMLP